MSSSILVKLASEALKDQSSREVLVAISKSAKSLPPTVERYVKEHKEQGADEGKAWALAWSRYCQFKNPDSPHCKSDEYFHGRGPKTAKKLDTIWLVTDPTPESEIVDILAGVRDGVQLGRIIRGTRPQEWDSSNPAIHTDLASAKKDAMGRLKRFHKGDIPDWVFESEIRGTDFRMAKLIEETDHLGWKTVHTEGSSAPRGFPVYVGRFYDTELYSDRKGEWIKNVTPEKKVVSGAPESLVGKTLKSKVVDKRSVHDFLASLKSKDHVNLQLTKAGKGILEKGSRPSGTEVPEFRNYDDAKEWLEKMKTMYGARRFRNTDLYKKAWPEINRLYLESEDFNQRSRRYTWDDVEERGMSKGDRVIMRGVGLFLTPYEITGVLIGKSNPKVRLDPNPYTHRSIMNWDERWESIRSKSGTSVQMSDKLDASLRRKINSQLSRAGLDGNGRWDRPEGGYVKALDVLSEFGIELGEVVSSHLFRRPSGTLNIEIAFTNPSDPFSPIQIRNSMLSLTYTEVGDGGRYETLAYLS